MKAAGYLLITAAFLVGSYVAVERAEGVPWLGYVLCLAVGAAGVAAVRVATHREARHEDTIAANIYAIETSLASIVEKIEALDRDKESIDVYALRHEIDRRFPAGERYLNRVWSTSTDGYVDEAHACLAKSHAQFQTALEVFQGLQKP